LKCASRKPAARGEPRFQSDNAPGSECLIDKAYRVNERIRAPQVRVIAPDGEQVGVMPTRQAVEEAQRRGLDLIEVAPNADPPVCRMMDHGKFRYEQQKKARDAKKKSKQTQLKTLRIRPNTDDHDVEFKMRNAERFLKKGDMVKFNVIFRGPELRHKDRGRDQLLKFAEGLSEIGEVDQPPRMEGRRMTMLIRPKTVAE
jgi:translation initiation factor IF-3